MTVLFDGHPAILGITPGMRYRLHHPHVCDEPVLESQHPVDTLGVSYACVLPYDGGYRMWYQAWPDDWDGQDVLRVAVADSDDGLHWRRHSAGLVEYNGSTDNPLTDLPVHCATVVIDDTAPADQRYRAFGFFRPRAIKGMPGNFSHLADYKGYVTATSADGIHWPAESIAPLWPQEDVITAAAADNNSVLLMMKRCRIIRGMLRRTFYSAHWRNGTLSEPVEALCPDEYDDMLAQMRGACSADYYGAGLHPQSDGSTIGFLWNFRHQHPLGHHQLHHATWGDTGLVDITLINRFSEGGSWHHMPGRPVWLGAEHLPEWAGGAIYTSPNVVTVADESYLYYTGSQEYHGWAGAGVDYLQYFRSTAGKGGFAKIGLLRWPRERLVGLHAEHPEMLYLNAVPFEGSDLSLNIHTRPDGYVRAALLDYDTHKAVEGFTLEDSTILTGNHLNAALRWNDRTGLPPEYCRRTMMVQIEIAQGAIYSYDLTNV